jgi:hypothetical protein
MMPVGCRSSRQGTAAKGAGSRTVVVSHQDRLAPPPAGGPRRTAAAQETMTISGIY